MFVGGKGVGGSVLRLAQSDRHESGGGLLARTLLTGAWAERAVPSSAAANAAITKGFACMLLLAESRFWNSF